MAVDFRDTLVVCLRSESVADAAKALNISEQAMNYRLTQMKKAGVKVPKKERKRRPLDTLEVAQLNSLIIKHTKEM